MSTPLTKLKNIWIGGDKIKTDTIVRIYKALAKLILAYSSGTWVLTQTEEANLISSHRKQLKQILHIKYLVKV